ncbi:oligosaccharide flippase family protein [Pluralibacter gergoviae]|uniref:oligosaccharide flippase family protein n=1 Tax=Pluralibacter gergoviae TaxID=61647 RepID=UPI00190BA85E|nr:oligosaccharide flippase family protein [Pluralibacter gergoviae]ELC3073466.1 oligosaccharide flippase family protein [Pluralibacter gergoviae]MBK4115001.1 oligosaccharide flippase family protein [Pluralibacter gergoviae]
MNKAAIINTLWMVLEKIVLIVGYFLVSALVARYLGPAMVGQLAYLVAVYQIVQVIAKWGSESVIFRRVSKKPQSGSRCLQASLRFRLTCLLGLAIPLEIYFYVSQSTLFFIFSAAVALSALFSSLDVYAVYYNARLRSQYNTVINCCGLICSLILRAIAVFMVLKPAWLVLPIMVNSGLPLLLRYIKYRRSDAVVLKKENSRHYQKYFFHSGKHLVFSALAVSLYTQCQNFFIYHYAGSAQLGIYTVAVTFTAGAGAFINALITSCYVSIYAEPDPQRAKEKAGVLLRWVAAAALLASIATVALGGFIIDRLYGAEYALAREPLIILSLAAMLSFMGTVTYRYIMHYSGFYYLSIKTLFTLVISVMITGGLVKHYGIIGAAWATVIVELLSLTLLNYFFKNHAVLKLHLFSIRGR